MLQYLDLELRDVSYYWGESTLLFERRGTFIPCRIQAIDEESDFPIRLVDSLSGKKLINVKLNSFIQRILVHHPALGYADYSGLPIYLSTRANRGRGKGLDPHNIRTLCPIDIQGRLMQDIQQVCEKGREVIDGGKKEMPQEIRDRYTELLRAANRFGVRYGGGARRWGQHVVNADGGLRVLVDNPPMRRGAAAIAGEVGISNHKVIAELLAQCVNDNYPSYRSAIKKLLSDKSMTGISLSKDFAVIRTGGDNLALYHKMSHVGTLRPSDHEITWNKRISQEGRDVLQIVLDKVRR